MYNNRVLWVLTLLIVYGWSSIFAQETQSSTSNAGPQSRGLRKKLCKRYGICQSLGGQFGNGGFGGYGGYQGYPGAYPVNIGISQSQSAEGGGGYSSNYPNYNQYHPGYHNQGYGGYPGPFYSGYPRPGINNYPGYNNFNVNYFGPPPFGYNNFNQRPFGYDEYNNGRPGYFGNRIETSSNNNNYVNNQDYDSEESLASGFSGAGR